MTYVKLFLDSLELLEPLDDAGRGRLLTALLQYAKDGEIPTLSGGERFLFPVFRQQYDRDAAQYEQRAEKQRANGSKGGRPRKREENPMVFSKTQKSQDEDKDQGAAPSAGAEGDVAAVAVAAAAWEEQMNCPLSPRGRHELAEFVADMGVDCCLRAFDTAQDAGRPTWAYVRGILRGKREQGVRSLSDWDRMEQARCGKSSAQPSPERIQRSNGWLDSFLAEMEQNGA